MKQFFFPFSSSIKVIQKSNFPFLPVANISKSWRVQWKQKCHRVHRLFRSIGMWVNYTKTKFVCLPPKLRIWNDFLFKFLGQTLVDCLYDANIQTIYFKQQLNDNKIDYILPMSVNENINLLRLHQIRRQLCNDDSTKGLVVAVVCANGAVIYQRFSDGKVLDFRIQNWGLNRIKWIIEE